MKIISITLQDSFNSLQPFDNKSFTHIDGPEKKIDPICLIGVNGSGKSNLLELLVEAFFYVELNHRFEKTKSQKTKSKKKFEIVYCLDKFKDKKIKLETITSNFARIWVESNVTGTEWEEVKDSEAILGYLPAKIVGYTSGMNETLSFRFNQLDEEYSGSVLSNARNKSQDILPDNRMIFLDYESNEAIVISNFLFRKGKELDVFNKLLRIKDLESFKIIINLKRKGKSGQNSFVILSKELVENIEKLRSCATCFFIDEDEKYYEFDFLNNEITRDAFKYHFNTVYDLFMAFQKLELLNPLNLDKKYRKTGSTNDLTDNKPTLAKEDKIFRFEEIILNISKPKKSIPYIGISDGEHQFLQVIGAIIIFNQPDVLFLFDEPETHFNPSWRTKFIFIMNVNTKGRNQEIAITTHSPYIVSDCKGYRVYKFTRKNDSVSFDEIGIETYGTSFDVILKTAFDIDGNISEEAIHEIKELMQSENTEKIQEFIDQSGPSFEKLALLKRLKDLESKENN